MVFYSKEDRNFSIDILRGISIFVVVFMHFNIVWPENTNISFFPLSSYYFGIMNRNGYYGVSIFFAISGFLITCKLLERSNYKLKNIVLGEFYTFRFSRIFPGLIILCLINLLFFALDFPGFESSLGQYTWKDLLVYIFTFRFDLLYVIGGTDLWAWSVLWSLAIEEVFYCFYPLICITLRSCYLLFLTLLLIVFYGVWYRTETKFFGAVFYFGCFDQLALGCIAALCISNDWVQKYRTRLINNFITLVGILLMFYIYCRAPVREDAVFGPTFMALGASFYLFGQSKIKTHTNKHAYPFFRLKKICEKFMLPIAFLGVLSYEIYLFHMVIYLLLKPFFSDLYLLTSKKIFFVPLNFLLILILLLLVNGLLYLYLLEPVRQWIRRTMKKYLLLVDFNFILCSFSFSRRDN